MKKNLTTLCVILFAISIFAVIGCGGGGGGGGVTGPDNSVPQIPADSAFAPPALFSSEAFPKQGPTANITLNSFATASEAWLFLMNYADSTQQVGYDISGPSFGASKRAAVIDSSTTPVTAEQLFHWQLRQKARQMVPPTPATDQSVRGNVRAVVNVVENVTKDNFMVYADGFDNPAVSIAATCRLTRSITNEPIKKIHFFVDDRDSAMTDLKNLLERLAADWMNIYAKNREVFGEEPTGKMTNGIDATDFYVFLSRSIPVTGYFFTGDLNAITVTSDSNQKKMFNLQLPPGLSDLEGVNNFELNVLLLASTMAHEFQHMIHYNIRGNVSDPLEQGVWLEEAMSGYAEYINGYRIENRKNQSKALQVRKYFELIKSISFNKWHDKSERRGDIINAFYGKAYLFGVWLAQNYGTNGVVKNLLTQRLSDEQAVENFARLKVPDETFEIVFAKFMMALAVNDYGQANYYGIKDLNLQGNYSFDYISGSVKLNGPAFTGLDVKSGSIKDTENIAPFTVSYVKISNSGESQDLSILATLPQYTAMFQIHR